MDRVEQNIFSRCERREVKEVVKTVFKGRKGENAIKAKIEETTKLIPPDVGAMCFVLKTQRGISGQNIKIRTLTMVA